jgi:hypothetical protein
MLAFLRRSRTDGRLVDAELENLAAWAEREWPLLWEYQFGVTTLEDALGMFLSDGAEHARSVEVLERAQNAVIARALLSGIARANTHPRDELEAALGVPLPKEPR